MLLVMHVASLFQEEKKKTLTEQQFNKNNMAQTTSWLVWAQYKTTHGLSSMVCMRVGVLQGVSYLGKWIYMFFFSFTPLGLL